MGCDIHIYAERRNEKGQWEEIPDLPIFEGNDYAVFGFMADVRNYSAISPIAEKRGIPTNASMAVRSAFKRWERDAHSASWLSLTELCDFDYDAMCEDRRCTRQTGPNSWSGGHTCEPGEGVIQSYREFLGEWFFDDLQTLCSAGAERIVFWFDN